MTLHDPIDNAPVPLGVAIGETLDEMTRRAEVDAATERWWYEFGRQTGHAEGYAAAEADMTLEWAAVAEYVRGLPYNPAHAELERIRWELRGQPRTRETFANPHSEDNARTGECRGEAA